MMFALDTKKLRLAIAAAALGLGAMGFSASTEARGFGGFHGGGMMPGVGGFRGPIASALRRAFAAGFYHAA
jgi:hypothetical protein